MLLCGLHAFTKPTGVRPAAVDMDKAGIKTNTIAFGFLSGISYGFWANTFNPNIESPSEAMLGTGARGIFQHCDIGMYGTKA